MAEPHTQVRWQSRRAFILAVTGAAVGLGNIWRFPYITGENGGSAFLLQYVLFILVLGLPVMMAEIMIGRSGRAGPLAALTTLAKANGASTNWRWLAVFGGLTLFLILSFYAVVSGWSLAYLGKSISGDFVGVSAAEAGGQFNGFLQDLPLMLGCHIAFLLMTMVVVARGVSAGLERLNNWLMPLLYLLLLLLAGYAVTTPGFATALHWLFWPNPDALSWQVTLDAMGHAFFTLAVGACALMAYGAYMPEQQSLPRAAVAVAVLDVVVALLAGIAIFAVVFSHGMEPAAGPGLMFVTLPVAFAEVPGGTVWLSAFFVLLVLATWTSSINLAEPLVAMLVDKHWSRPLAAAVVGLSVWGLGLLAALSFSLLADWHPLAFMAVFEGKTLFDLLTSIPPDLFLPLGGLFIAWFAAKVLSFEQMAAALGSASIARYWRMTIVWLSIPLLLLILLVTLYRW
ncbi:sodium-dependent transporter [Bacterioplanes sanyensis]|uniref:Sodium-dependent transporter n=1 Tax=Bacterioplanes sanyensis TaxID=1249553 RepID=A0A222FK05_9GAMM|nr:sodium-dependent transporter [Bacterioplanes sanyensis]ASP38563.1 sodium-dependent transporter [Bacterioplanes sanyensis]